jgi:hypothetical protein
MYNGVKWEFSSRIHDTVNTGGKHPALPNFASFLGQTYSGSCAIFTFYKRNENGRFKIGTRDGFFLFILSLQIRMCGELKLIHML